MRCSVSCGVCRICVMEACLASQSSFSSLPSCTYYPRLHQRNPTLHYTRARFEKLHLTGTSTNTHSEHKTSFSISPCHLAGSLVNISLLISSTSSCYY